MKPLKPDPLKDVIVGAGLWGGIAGVLLFGLGLQAIAWLLVTVFLVWLVLDLWFSGSEWRRVLAVVLMPALLLVYLMPRRYKRALAQWRREGVPPKVGEP